MKRLLTIIAIMASCSAASAQQWLDKAVREGKVSNVWNGQDLPQGFNGKGVIIGITDWGFDYTHPVFYDTSMTRYRVLRAWDQYRKARPAPEGFSYGTEIIGEQALLAAKCDTANVYSYNYHGNHVGSIAAGGGAGTPYRGVAHEAELLFVSFLVDEQAAIDAFNWMYNVAQQEQKRLVINMSWGLYYMGCMDGTGRLAEAMRELTDKGVLFVSSGGNNGDVSFHIKKEFTSASDTLKTGIAFDKAGNPNTWGQRITMLSSPGGAFSFSVQLRDKSNRLLQASDFLSTTADSETDTFIVHSDSLRSDTLFFKAYIEKSNPYNKRPLVHLLVRTLPSDRRAALFVTADSGCFHAWNVVELTNGVGNWGDEFTADAPGWSAGDIGYGVGMPAAAPCAIAVAAYESTYKIGTATRGGNIASFSSAGPGLNGETKPEIAAPGYQVVAGISSFTDRYQGTYTKKIEFQGREYGFAPLSGTSMASPFAAGVAALLLQANPNLSPDQIKTILIETATQDYDTRHDGPERFGHGKINALEAVKKALEMNGTQDFRTGKARYDVFPNPSNGQFYVTFQGDGTATAELFDVNGRLLLRQPLNPGVQPIATEKLAKGIYFLKLNSRQGSDIRKVVLQ